MIPGRVLYRIAARLCSAQSSERVIEPAIADLQKEYAMPMGAFARAWVLGVGYLAIIKVISICAVSVSTATNDERRAIVRTGLWSVCIVLAMTAVLIVPPYYNFTSGIRGTYPASALVMTLVPQAVPLAIPFGIAFGLAFGLVVRPTSNFVKGVLLGAIAASALSFCVLVWVMPAGNQAFHEIIMRVRFDSTKGPVVELQKGYNEMTLSELRGEIARFTEDGETRKARVAAFRLHLRIALAGASIALACVLLASPVRNRGWRGLLALGLCAAYWALMFIGESSARRGYLPAAIGAWLPNMSLVATAMLVAPSRSSRLRGYSSSTL